MSKIIQLKESLTGKKDNSNPIDQRGEFTVNLNPPVILNKNDQLGVRSCFLDTRSTTQGKITIDATNQNIELSHYLYITDRQATEPAEFQFFDLEGATPAEKVHPDGQRYILSRLGSGVNNNLGYITSMTIPRSSFDDPSQPYVGGFDFTMSYQATDPTDPTKFVTKTHTLSTGDTTTEDVKCEYQNKKTFAIAMFNNGVGKGGCDIKIEMSKHQQNENQFHKLDQFNVTTEDAPNAKTLEPVPIKYRFSLNTGNYAPEDLAKSITDKLVIYKTTPTGGNTGEFTFTEDPEDVNTGFVVNNPYFTSMGQLDAEDANWGLQGSDKIFFVREDGKCILKTTGTPNDYYVGCSELSLEFNDATQKFVWDQIHQPIFHQADAQAPVQVVNTLVTRGDGKKVLVGHSAGICFTNPSTDLNNFLLEDLGFGADLFVQPEKGQQNVNFVSPNGDREDAMITQSFQLSSGINVTGGITGVDSAVLKSNDFDKVPSDADISNTGILNNFNIFAAKATSEPQLIDGYFLVEIEGMPSLEFLGLDKKAPNVQAIVSRYYATADFVIMEGYSGSMPYTHTSDEPFILSSVRVRVLNSDGSTIPQLGDNNTIFLEYQKGESE